VDTSISPTNKFLRLKRFQQNQPAGLFDPDTDINCLACHEKDGWSTSAHADPQVADETYQQQPAELREFPNGLPVWQAACLNCHDTHSVHGSRRLLREGTDAPGTPKSGGQSAIEETCYQCHSAAPIVNNPNGDVKDLQTEFNLAVRMPITTADQRATTEVHDIVDGDTTEPRSQLGRGDHINRHAECTDCHNPHRVMRNTRFDGVGTTAQATHDHSPGHTNIASGVLRGTWGVEPVYGGGEFLALPTGYEVKRGDGGIGASASVNAPHVTREYQVCLKCHSDYGYNDDGVYPVGTRPDLGVSGGGTAFGTNDLDQYTNQAMEFQAPLGDRGEPGGNHRSWHPVIESTGRSAADRTMTASPNMFLPPWNGANIGSQTMYCSDCHGRNTPTGTVEPPADTPWGPHGSENNFILKGTWGTDTGANESGICFRCHNRAGYAVLDNSGDAAGWESGFGNDRAADTNLHAFHAEQLGRTLRCVWCHVAVPHGWKNKSLLVNLNDVGPEAGLAPGTEVSITANTAYTQGPYYLNAKLKVLNFAQAGTWEDTDCGSASGQGEQGKDWMRNVCENPP
jgi:cytochrome c553